MTSSPLLSEEEITALKTKGVGLMVTWLWLFLKAQMETSEENRLHNVFLIAKQYGERLMHTVYHLKEKIEFYSLPALGQTSWRNRADGEIRGPYTGSIFYKTSYSTNPANLIPVFETTEWDHYCEHHVLWIISTNNNMASRTNIQSCHKKPQNTKQHKQMAK